MAPKGRSRADKCFEFSRLLSTAHSNLSCPRLHSFAFQFCFVFLHQGERDHLPRRYMIAREREASDHPQGYFSFSRFQSTTAVIRLSLFFLRSKPAHVKVGIEASFLPSPSYVADARNKNYANKNSGVRQALVKQKHGANVRSGGRTKWEERMDRVREGARKKRSQTDLPQQTAQSKHPFSQPAAMNISVAGPLPPTMNEFTRRCCGERITVAETLHRLAHLDVVVFPRPQFHVITVAHRTT